MKKLTNIYSILFYVLCFFLPFENNFRALPNIILIILAVLFPFLIKKEKILHLINKSYIIFFLLIIYITVRSCFIELNNLDFEFIKKTLIVLAFVIFSLPVLSKKRIVFSFILGVFFSIVISSFFLIEYIIVNRNFNFSNGGNINEILITERLYLGFMCTISFAFSFIYLSKQKKLIDYALAVNILLCSFFVFIISARIAIISIILIILMYVYSYLNIKKALLLSILFLSILIGSFMLNPNLGNRFFYLNDDNKDYFQKLKDWEPRVVIWDCSSIIFMQKNNIVFGEGLYLTKKNLQKCYKNVIKKENKRNWFVEKGFNTHNQFIDFLINYGIIGVSLFILFFIITFYYSKNSIHIRTTLFALFLFCLVENIFHRQMGAYLFSLILIIITNFNVYIKKTP